MRRLSRRQLWIGATILAVVLMALLVMRPETLEVGLATVTSGPLRVTVDEDGVTRHENHVQLSAPVNGRLAESLVEAGDTVTRGQVVARIAPAPLDERARQQAQATLQAAGAIRVEAEARVSQATIALDAARRARSRAERLAQAGAISARELEDAVADVRLREQDLDAARARVGAAAQQERAARTALLGSDPSRAGTPAPVVVRSPLDGRVLRIFEEHQRVVPAGAPLLEVGDPASIEVVVDVLSSDAVDIRPGASATVSVPPGRTLSAVVTRVEPAAFIKLSPLGVEERRVNVELALQGPVAGLGDEFEVDVSIVLWEAERVLQVPATSLVPVDTAWGVYVVEGGRARLRAIETGHRGGRDVEVLRGLTEGERVVRFPDERITEGVRIRAR